MVKNILVIGDLGAATNLVKNLLLLSPATDWPLSEDRFEKIARQYDITTSFSNWLDKEYSLRYWKRFYGIDLSDDLDWDLYQKTCKSTEKPIVFLNHSALWQLEQFEKFSQQLDVIFVSPITPMGLDWQIRSYCEKKSVKTMHDFTFENDVANRKQKFIEAHGHEAYDRLNIENMKQIIGERQDRFAQILSPLPLEIFVHGDVKVAYEYLQRAINISIDFVEFSAVLTAWRDLHWPFDWTWDWTYGNLV